MLLFQESHSLPFRSIPCKPLASAWRADAAPLPFTQLGRFCSMSRPLQIAACRSVCSWHATGELLEDDRLFACAGCGSEWVASEPWTPIDATGSVPVAVQEERRRGRG